MVYLPTRSPIQILIEETTHVPAIQFASCHLYLYVDSGLSRVMSTDVQVGCRCWPVSDRFGYKPIIKCRWWAT